jgi:hypothetical protein
MTENLCGFAVLLVLAVGVALLVYLLVRKSLRSLLDDVLPSGTAF